MPAELPVVVCDAHHHVLRHWLEAPGKGLLPAQGSAVVHFDAHPDLGSPERPIDRRWLARPGAIVNAVDIASFQLPAVWLGAVDEVLWLRPAWASQLGDGRRQLHVGARAGGRLAVDEPSDYWVLDDGFAETSELEEATPFSLEVRALDSADAVSWPDAPVVLDIDLDAFATRNPAADRLRDAGLGEPDIARLRRTFARERLSLPEPPGARREAYAALKTDAGRLGEGSAGDALAGAYGLWQAGIALPDLYFLWRLARSGEPVDIELLLREGELLVGLPEHAPDAEASRRSLEALVAPVRSGALVPSLVTIARSVNDGFAPAASWPALETALLEALAEAASARGRTLRVSYDRGLRPVEAR